MKTRPRLTKRQTAWALSLGFLALGLGCIAGVVLLYLGWQEDPPWYVLVGAGGCVLGIVGFFGASVHVAEREGL